MTIPTPDPRAITCLLALAGCLAAPLPSAQAGEVFKCAGRDGIPMYQDTPCPAGRELRNFQTDPPEITILPAPELSLEPRPAADARRPPRESAAKAPAPRAEANPGGDAAERRFLRAGMTEGEVIAKVGPPEVTSRGSKKSAARWTYLPAPRDPETITIVNLSDGVVTDVVRKLAK